MSKETQEEQIMGTTVKDITDHFNLLIVEGLDTLKGLMMITNNEHKAQDYFEKSIRPLMTRRDNVRSEASGVRLRKVLRNET